MVELVTIHCLQIQIFYYTITGSVVYLRMKTKAKEIPYKQICVVSKLDLYTQDKEIIKMQFSVTYDQRAQLSSRPNCKFTVFRINKQLLVLQQCLLTAMIIVLYCHDL